MTVCGHFVRLKITFDCIYPNFSSMSKLNFFFHKMAAGDDFHEMAAYAIFFLFQFHKILCRWPLWMPENQFDRFPGHFRSTINFH